MLAKHTRLTAAEVREILKSGRSARSGSLSAKYKVISPAKAAVVVSSKVAKSAVSRNRLRRKAYAILKEALPKGVQSVFFLHKPAFDSTELIELCSKLSS
jgi:ribonuclease P protein component